MRADRHGNVFCPGLKNVRHSGASRSGEPALLVRNAVIVGFHGPLAGPVSNESNMAPNALEPTVMSVAPANRTFRASLTAP